ncbi:hypothetical protein M5D96_008100 [Drosophila gunungcola]|uniref:Uncharacterized protein n=1 Tax=Drosophila gunungcola TaxID=103775 RepID=A0A9Q0BNW5_9MUSC|nr:hypothetical protein M5D96_008100 [Drosophila gunungcola]
MSSSSSPGLSGSFSKSLVLKIRWHVEQVRVPSQAPKPSRSTLLLTTTSSRESPTLPEVLILSPLARTKVMLTLQADDDDGQCLV